MVSRDERLGRRLRLAFLTMMITKQVVARQLAAYLGHEITLAQLVDWAEAVLVDTEFEERDAHVLAEVVGRLGVADVRAFGLTWEDCEALLQKVGVRARVALVPA